MNALQGEPGEEKEESKSASAPPTTNGTANGDANGSATPVSIDNDVVMQDLSDLSEVSDGGSETPSTTSANGKKASARQKELRQKVQSTALAKQREAARQKQASIKQAQAEHRRLDEEVNKLERRLESIERDFRKLLGAVRVKPLGKDRFHNRIWWFDGMGSASLVGSGGIAQYGTGRLFIQGPSEFDQEVLEQKKKEEDVDGRRKEEEGESGVLGSGDWAVYTEMEEVGTLPYFCLRLLTLSDLYSWKNTSPGSITKANANLRSGQR